jgi:RNA polymerase sigma-70 factor (ECF subfamily)
VASTLSTSSDNRSLSDAFLAGFERERSYVCHSLRRLGIPPAHVEDLAQDVFVKAFQSFTTYDPSRPLRPWLFGIAFRLSTNFRKQAVFKYEETGAELPEVACDKGGPEQSLSARQARELILRSMDPLDPDRRAVFILHDIDGLSVPEAALALDIPVNTAYSRLRAARAQVIEEVRRLQGGGAT